MTDQGLPSDIIPVRVFLVGERLDTRGLERPSDSLGVAPFTLRLPEGGLAVLFRYGVVVIFRPSPTAEEGLFRKIAPFVIGPFANRESDDARLQINHDVDEQIDGSGTIVLKRESVERLQLVADVLAKSIILTHYETRIAVIFDHIEPLAVTLREKGREGAAGRELLRQIGNVLLIQHRMVGRVETGEKPELLWDYPELERLHLRLSEEYELRERSRALDRKLEVITRTVTTLLGLSQSRSSLRVEWYIVIIIIAELILAVYTVVLPR